MRVRRAVTRKVVPTSVSHVLRQRRSGGAAQESGKEGAIVRMRDGEEFVLKALRYAPAMVQEFRHGDRLHVSDLLGKCIRKIALAERLNLPVPASNVLESMALVFAQGNAIHDYVKARIGKGHPEKLYGRWACLCGKTSTKPMTAPQIPKIHCQECGTVPYRYQELELHNEELDIVGSPDIVLFLPDLQVYYPVEIKSITYDDWKELARPKPDHVLQVLFYWYLMKELGYSLPHQVSILYVSKGFLFKSPYKEFVVEVQAELPRLDPYLAEARALKDAKLGGEIPARTLCSSVSCSEAKKCHIAVPCFQIN